MQNILLSAVMAFSFFTVKVYDQVGINTSTPQGNFTIDATKENLARGTPTAAQQDNDKR